MYHVILNKKQSCWILSPPWSELLKSIMKTDKNISALPPLYKKKLVEQHFLLKDKVCQFKIVWVLGVSGLTVERDMNVFFISRNKKIFYDIETLKYPSFTRRQLFIDYEISTILTKRL